MRGRDLGSEFGDYRLVRRMAVGGFSDIYLAQRFGKAGYERTVVLKRIRGDLADDDHFAEQVMEETRILPLLQHENVVRTIEVGEQDGSPFMVMEFIFGPTLQQIFDRCQSEDVRVPLEHMRTILADVLDALEYAHVTAVDREGRALKVVHRDVCPSNVMVGFDGLVRLIDFGVAKSEAQTSSTRVGMVKGRVSYMSPEQVRRAPLDARSDLFAVGSVLLESLLGRRLFEGPTEFETVKAVLSHPIPRAPRYIDAEGRRVWQVARRALFRRRWLRYPSARAMRDALLMGDGRGREEARDELELWLGAVFARELERREMALRKARGSPTEFRILRDSGFELLPEVTDPLAQAQPSMLKVMDKTRSIKGLPSRRSWWAVGAVFGLASIGLGAFLARLDQAPGARSGLLFVASDGPCEVILGGRPLGSAPIVSLELPQGTHEIGCRSSSPGRKVKILIREGQSRFVQLESEQQGEED